MAKATTPQIEQIEIEAVVAGALQRIRFGAGTNPADVPGYLKELDPNCQMRDGFPVKGVGRRDTKHARVVMVNLKASGSGLFIDLIAHNADDGDFSISVPKKSSEGFRDAIAGLNVLSEANLAKLDTAISGQKQATVILSEGEQFGAKYWSSDDGKHFLDELTSDAPKAEGAAA